jgi:hypothetical protein
MAIIDLRMSFPFRALGRTTGADATFAKAKESGYNSGS